MGGKEVRSVERHLLKEGGRERLVREEGRTKRLERGRGEKGR